MLTVDDFGQIRIAHRDGMTIRAIARAFHHSRRKVREALASPESQPYTRTKDPPAPKLGPFKPIIDEILKSDEQAPVKQRHTAAQIFRRLHAEYGYNSSYRQECGVGDMIARTFGPAGGDAFKMRFHALHRSPLRW
ncbi:MAG: hypothetical protein AABZ47_18895 [Planctomycetota bacterium]